jgi:hypothetical protein
LAAGALGLELALGAAESLVPLPAVLLLLSPLPQAVSASDAVASTMAVRQARVGRVIEPP